LSKKIKVQDSEVKMARQLIQQLSSGFDPEEFADEYRAKLEELVQAKVDGQEVTVAAEPKEEPTKVVDLMEALKASVEEAKKRKGGDSSSSKKKKTSARPARKASAS
jgi:DNA end-binding protein Ku